jgi:hypothetical protein
MSDSVTPSVLGSPIIVMPTESPTRIMSTPARSANVAVAKSYAVTNTALSPRRLSAPSVATVTLPFTRRGSDGKDATDTAGLTEADMT